MSALRPSAPGDAIAPRRALLRLERLHKQLIHAIDRVLLPEDLSLAEWLIVSELGAAGESSLSCIARVLSRDAGSLSRTVTRLIQRKLLESARNGCDRRRATLSLTRQGHVLHERVARAIECLAWRQPALEALAVEHLASRLELPDRPAAPRTTAAKAPGRDTHSRHGFHAPTQENDS